MDWVTSLRAPAVAALARGDGPLQMSLSGTQNLAEITHPDYPGERLICCHNPFLAADRARRREALLAATEKDLEKIAAAAAAGRLEGAGKIGERAGKVINAHNVGKHFLREITGTAFTYRRDQEKIAAEADLDGIYVIRTSVKQDTLGPAGVITACKNLKYVERDFRIAKADDLDLRPIYHYLEERVRAHVLICMLAAYLTWHLREALAELTFTDQGIPPLTTRYPPRGAHRTPGTKTPANATAASCPSANTATSSTSSTTSPPSTGRSSTSAGSELRNSPAPRPSSNARSNCSALPCPSPSSSQ